MNDRVGVCYQSDGAGWPGAAPVFPADSVYSAVRYGVDSKGEKAMINSSRQIIYASREKDFAEAARKDASELREQISA